jgi:hypothetical protein
LFSLFDSFSFELVDLLLLGVQVLQNRFFGFGLVSGSSERKRADSSVSAWSAEAANASEEKNRIVISVIIVDFIFYSPVFVKKCLFGPVVCSPLFLRYLNVY